MTIDWPLDLHPVGQSFYLHTLTAAPTLAGPVLGFLRVPVLVLGTGAFLRCAIATGSAASAWCCTRAVGVSVRSG